MHSEAYAAGELKHGTISLIEDGTLVVAVATQPALYQKTISNIVEVKARGAFVMAITTEDNTAMEKRRTTLFISRKPIRTSQIPLRLFLCSYLAIM